MPQASQKTSPVRLVGAFSPAPEAVDVRRSAFGQSYLRASALIRERDALEWRAAEAYAPQSYPGTVAFKAMIAADGALVAFDAMHPDVLVEIARREICARDLAEFDREFPEVAEEIRARHRA